MKRREFLKTAVLGSSGLLLLNGNGWAAQALGDEKTRKRLVVVLLRGAVDGLNVVVPYSESGYYSSRPTIAIPRPGENGGVLPKAEQLRRIDSRIKRLEDEKACVSAATTREAIRSCRQQFRPMQKSGSVQ